MGTPTEPKPTQQVASGQAENAEKKPAWAPTPSLFSPKYPNAFTDTLVALADMEIVTSRQRAKHASRHWRAEAGTGYLQTKEEQIRQLKRRDKDACRPLLQFTLHPSTIQGETLRG